MDIQKITVIGGGLMGRQIALNASIYGVDATVYDLKGEVCDAVEAWKEEYLAGRIAKGRMTAEKVAEIKTRFHVEKDYAKALAGSHCVIEAVVEVEEIKRSVFRQLSDAVGEDVILATNSSFMVSSKFADCVKNPARLANMHFYNPALVMKFVEIVQGPHTSEETAKSLFDFCTKTGKTPIWMKKELPGFAANHMLRAINDSARWLVQNGYCTPQEVDLACENGLNHPMGPFRLNDLTGIDLTFDIMKSRLAESGVKPDMYDIYEQMVKEGKLGRKTKHGFYDYE